MNVAVGKVRKGKLTEQTLDGKIKKKSAKADSIVKHIPVTRSRLKASSIDQPNDSNSDPDNSKKTNYKRFKESENSNEFDCSQESDQHQDNIWEKENIVDSSWIKSGSPKAPSFHKISVKRKQVASKT